MVLRNACVETRVTTTKHGILIAYENKTQKRIVCLIRVN